MGVSLFTLTAIFSTIAPLIAEIIATVSNPVTYALNATGSGTRYDVYSDADIDLIPFSVLTAGSVINIFYKPTPYLRKFGIRAQGTQATPVILNGVTNASGLRPVFNASGSTTAPLCNPSGGYVGQNDLFSATPAYGESFGCISILKGVGDPYTGYKPKWIEVRNIEVKGVNHLTSYTALNGSTQQFGTFVAGIWIQLGADILIENCVVYDNVMGLMVMSKEATLDHACERITMRNNRFFGNGRVGADGVHTVYMQCTNPIIEGNYFGPNRVGAIGSTFKDRSSGLVFRYNYIQSSARSLDMVHSEDQDQGISAQSDYGTDYVYGNVFENDFSIPGSGAGNPIHYGGDNLGEDYAGQANLVVTPPYRSQLYFWNNTVINSSDSAESYRVQIFDLSLVGTKVDIWNNVFINKGTSEFIWLEWAGILNIRGQNHVLGTISADARPEADPDQYTVNQLGTLVSTGLTVLDYANSDYRLAAGSSAIDASTVAPAGIIAGINTSHPINYQPLLRMNGLVARTVQGSALDLGALEYGLGTGLPPLAPVNTVLPLITGVIENDSTLSISQGTWTGSPTNFTYQWKKNGVAINGAAGTNYIALLSDVGSVITVTVTATNSVDSVQATSLGVTVNVANLPVNTVLPEITGALSVGSVLTVTSGTWTNSPTYTYQWNKNGVAIPGKTLTTYTVVAGDIDATITVTVTASNINGSGLPAISNGVVIPTNVPAFIGNVTSDFDDTSDDTPSLIVPTGAVAGDEYWMAIRSSNPTATITWPSGFTEEVDAFAVDNNLGIQLRVAKRTATGSETGSFDAISSSYHSWSAICAVVKGAAATPDDLSALGSYQYTSTKDTTGAPITTTGADRFILWFAGVTVTGITESATITPPAGLANAHSVNPPNGLSLTLCAGVQTSAGAATYSGVASFSSANGVSAVVSTIALIAD